MFLASAAGAQNLPDARSLMNRIDQLERQLETLSRAFYSEGRSPKLPNDDGSVSSSPSSLADFDERLNGVEQSNRDIVNKIEKLSYDLNLLQEDVKKLKIDTEQRFQEQSSSSAPAAQTVTTEESPDSSEIAEEGSSETIKPAASTKLGDNGESAYEKAFAKIKNSDYVGAQAEFKEFIKNYPESNLAPNSYYWLGETYYVEADYKSAAKSFARCFKNYPDSSKAPDSLLKLGLSLAAMGNKKDACISLDQLKKQSKTPDSPLMKRAEEEYKKLKCE